MNDQDSATHLVLAQSAIVGRDVRFGAHIVVHDDVVIGDDVQIADAAILGKRPSPTSGSTSVGGNDQPLRIGAAAIICTQAIIFTSAQIGARSIIGDQAFVRERATIGEDTVIGRGSTVDNDVSVGLRVRTQTGVYLAAFSVVEDDVFLGPGVITTNDHTMNRNAAGTELLGAILKRACRVGAGAVLTPGITIGEEAFVAAGAVVTADVPPRSVVMGVPARVVRHVTDEDLLEAWR